MIRKVLIQGFVTALLAASVSLIGCGGDDDDSSSAGSSPTPTAVPASPTPTATPTPGPMDDWFRVSELLVGDSTQGVDVDGQGGVDNSIEDTLNAVNDVIFTAILAAACDGATEISGCDGKQLQTAMTGIQTALDAIISVEGMSTALNAPIEGNTLHYLENFMEKTKGGKVTLAYNRGTTDNDGESFQVSKSMGSFEGSLSGGAGTFGPGTLEFLFTFPAPPKSGDDPTEITLKIYQSKTMVKGYNADELKDEMIGGAISQDDLMILVDLALTAAQTLYDTIGGSSEPPDWDQIRSDVEDTLNTYSDITLSDGANGFSIGLVAQAGSATVIGTRYSQP